MMSSEESHAAWKDRLTAIGANPSVVVLAASTIAYAMASIYVNAYLGVFGASMWWFEISLVKLLLVSWLPVSVGVPVAVASVLAAPAAVVGSRHSWYFLAVAFFAIMAVGFALDVAFSWTFPWEWLVAYMVLMAGLGYLIFWCRKSLSAKDPREICRAGELFDKTEAKVVFLSLSVFTSCLMSHQLGRLTAAWHLFDAYASEREVGWEATSRLLFTDGSTNLILDQLGSKNQQAIRLGLNSGFGTKTMYFRHRPG